MPKKPDVQPVSVLLTNKDNRYRVLWNLTKQDYEEIYKLVMQRSDEILRGVDIPHFWIGCLNTSRETI